MDEKRRMTDRTTTERFEEQAATRSREQYVLSLYVAGMTFRSTQAVDRIRTLCDRYLTGRYKLRVVDLYLQPDVARKAQIVVAPTLVKESPAPVQLFIGDMTDETRILQGLNVLL